jgi:nitrilase
MKRNRFLAAAVLASSSLFDKQKAMRKVKDLTQEAAGKGAKLVVFPETFVPNYPWWLWMGVNNPRKLDLYRRLYEHSLEAPGPELDELARLAEKLSIFISLGINERDGGTLYNSQVFIDDHGRLLGKRRKLMPTGEEKTVWGWGHGDDLKVFDTELGKIGALICYEHSMALARYALYSLGEEIHVANWPGANFKSQPRNRTRVIDAAMRHTAFEGQVFVIFSSSCLTPEEVAFYHDLDPSTKDLLEPGGGISGIVDPLGNYIAGPIEHREDIVIGEIDLGLIVDAKHMVDSVGHYARKDVFTLHIDRRPRPGVTASERETAPYPSLPADLWARLYSRICALKDPELQKEAQEFDQALKRLPPQ